MKNSVSQRETIRSFKWKRISFPPLILLANYGGTRSADNTDINRTPIIRFKFERECRNPLQRYKGRDHATTNRSKSNGSATRPVGDNQNLLGRRLRSAKNLIAAELFNKPRCTDNVLNSGSIKCFITLRIAKFIRRCVDLVGTRWPCKP